MSKLTISFQTEESFVDALLHFNDVCNVPPCNINEESKSMSYNIFNGIDDEVIVFLKEELDNVPHIKGYTFNYQD